MKVRNNQVSFLFEKGALLKLSKKAIHCASYIMDTYYEKKKEGIPYKDNSLVAACCLLLGGKAVELDDRIPFICKLKKYTGVFGSREQFKFYEVDIAETLNWDLQVLTFYDFVEHYLYKAVVSDEDKIFNKLLNSFSFDENVKVLDVISKISNSNDMMDKHHSIFGSTTRDKHSYSSSEKNSADVFEDPRALIKSFNKVNLKDNGATELKFLNPIMKENTLFFFENYVDLICEIIQKSYSVWNYDKKKLAIGIILFARSSIFSGSNTWNLRLEEITDIQ